MGVSIIRVAYDHMVITYVLSQRDNSLDYHSVSFVSCVKKIKMALSVPPKYWLKMQMRHLRLTSALNNSKQCLNKNDIKT